MIITKSFWLIVAASLLSLILVTGLFPVNCVGQQGDFAQDTPRPQIGSNNDLLSIRGWYAEVKRASGEIERIDSGAVLGLQVGQRAKIYATVKNADSGRHNVAIELCADNGRAIGLLMPSASDQEAPIYENCIDVRNEVEDDSWYQILTGETADYPAGDALAMRPGGGSLYIVLESPDSAGGDGFYELKRMAVEYDIAPDNSD